MKRVMILIILSLFVSVAAFAQDGESNACDEGGSMENRCHVDFNHDGEVDEYESDWAWQCGWYVARVEEGSLPASELPDGCNHTVPECYTVLPEVIEFIKAEVGDELDEEWGIDVDLLYEVSMSYFGSPNEFGNSFLYENANCAGEGYNGYSEDDISIFYGIVIADDEIEAMDICAGMGGLGALPISLAFNTPMNYWACISITGIDLSYISTGNAMSVFGAVTAEVSESR